MPRTIIECERHLYAGATEAILCVERRAYTGGNGGEHDDKADPTRDVVHGGASLGKASKHLHRVRRCRALDRLMSERFIFCPGAWVRDAIRGPARCVRAPSHA